MNIILGAKGKMSQSFIQGRRVPVTKVTAGPCVVTQIKNIDKDGYWGLQLGFGTKRTKNITKPLKGHLKKYIKENNAPSFLAEIRFEQEPVKNDGNKINLGDTITLSEIFKLGDMVSVSGISKGKGFAGGVKRWGFHGGPKTHGQSDRQRAPGSIGAGTTPGRVLKGKRMAGKMGFERVTVKNIQIVGLNEEANELLLSGPVPGISGGNIFITKLSEGKLEGIQEVQAQVIEGEAPAGEEGQGGENAPSTAPEAKEGVQEPTEQKEETNA